MAKKIIENIKFLCNGSPRFKVEGEAFQAKPGFNEMPGKFTTDPYFEMCANSGIVKEFISNPTDKQHENFDAQIKEERAKREAAEKELADLKAKLAGQTEGNNGTDEKSEQ